MFKKNKKITAKDIHEDLVLELPITEYYALFEIMLNNIIRFIKKTEKIETTTKELLKEEKNNEIN